MQTVGVNCAVCSKNVAYVGHALGCPECDAVYHEQCLSLPHRCPRCGRDLDEARIEMDMAAEARRAQAVRLHRAEWLSLVCLFGSGLFLFEIMDLRRRGFPPVTWTPYAGGVLFFVTIVVQAWWKALRKPRK